MTGEAFRIKERGIHYSPVLCGTMQEGLKGIRSFWFYKGTFYAEGEALLNEYQHLILQTAQSPFYAGNQMTQKIILLDWDNGQSIKDICSGCLHIAGVNGIGIFPSLELFRAIYKYAGDLED